MTKSKSPASPVIIADSAISCFCDCSDVMLDFGSKYNHFYYRVQFLLDTPEWDYQYSVHYHPKLLDKKKYVGSSSS